MPTRSTQWLRRCGNRALDLLFPPRCLACQVDCQVEWQYGNLCPECRESLLLTNWPTCRRCAARVPEIPGPVDVCDHCRADKLAFERAVALGSYELILRDLVVQMKRDVSGRVASLLGQLIVENCGAEVLQFGPEIVVPIPLQPLERFTREVNPAELLAMEVARRLRLPMQRDLLRWSRRAGRQVGLSRPGRFGNLRGALAVRPGLQLDEQRVLVVDDILTTGATCHAAAKALKQAGATEIMALVAARTPAS